jgi:long-subunit fatty acid transport protein
MKDLGKQSSVRSEVTAHAAPSRVCKVISLATAILLASVTFARASGLLLYETRAPDLGTASAGRTAMAADASTAAANPAGMTQLGFAYDSSTVSKTNRVPVVPIDRQLRYGTGIQYQVNDNVTAGTAWELMDADPLPTVLAADRWPERSKDTTQRTI